MEILFACHRVPYPPARGGKIRPFNMIQHLNRSHTIVVVSLAETEKELLESSDLKNYCSEVIVEVLPVYKRWIQAFLALFKRKSSSVAYFNSSRLHRRVQQIVRERKFDVVMTHCSFAAQYLIDVPAKRRILDFGDIDSAKWAAYAQCRKFPLSLGYALEAWKLRRYEKTLAESFGECTVTTSGELDEFRSFGLPNSCTLIPNGVNGEYYSPQAGGLEFKDGIIVFVGRMNYYPNIDGIQYFVKEILPEIRRVLPNVELRVVGAHPPPAIRRLNKIPGIVVTGQVKDVRPFLRDAHVSIAPLRIARGTQNKILESMAMGIPVVSTQIASKGIQATAGKHLLVAESSREFTQKVLEVLQNPDLRQTLSKMGRQQVLEAHAWAQSMEILDKVLNGFSGPSRAT